MSVFVMWTVLLSTWVVEYMCDGHIFTTPKWLKENQTSLILLIHVLVYIEDKTKSNNKQREKKNIKVLL